MYQPTMPVPEALDGLKMAAKADPALKAELLATRDAKYPLTTFCKIATEKGFPMSPMDVIDYGEQEVAAINPCFLRGKPVPGAAFDLVILCIHGKES